MIKANELRIGNWVEYETKNTIQNGESKYCRVVTLFEDGVFHFDNDHNDTYSSESVMPKPVPLTPEILKKAGFEFYYKHSISNNDIYRIKLDAPIVDAFLYENGTNILYLSCNGEEYVEESKIKHVHQLQNLYLALTEKELPIKL